MPIRYCILSIEDKRRAMMDTIIIRKNELYGLMDERGNVIIEAKYDDIMEPTNGYIGACKNGKWGYLDETGEQVIDFLYHDIKGISKSGVAPVKLHDRYNGWRIVNENGELKKLENDIKFTYISEFNNHGYAIVSNGFFYFIMEDNGYMVDNHAYSSLKYIESKDIYVGTRQGKLCLINRDEEVIVDPDDYYDIVHYPVDGLSLISKDNKYGYIDELGMLVIPLTYTNASDFSDNGLAYVEIEDGLGGYIDRDGAFVIEPGFDSGTEFSHGLAAVSRAGKSYYIDENGLKAININFKYAGAFSECGLAKVIMLNGDVLFIRPDSSIAYALKDGVDADEYLGDRKVSTIRSNGKVGLINDQGKIITPYPYDDIKISPYSNRHGFLLDDRWGYIDDTGQQVIENIYLEAEEFSSDHFATVKYDNPLSGEAISIRINQWDDPVNQNNIQSYWDKVHEKFAHIYEYHNGIALAIKKDETVLLNGKGEEWIDEYK